MKYMYILILLLMGCVNPEQYPKRTSYKVFFRNVVITFEEVTIDSCQYLIGPDEITHKGNCKNHKIQ